MTSKASKISKMLGLDEIINMNKRQFLFQLVNLGSLPAQSASHLPLFLPHLPQYIQTTGLIVSSALIIWKSLILYTNSESPIVVVLSGSMEPAFYRGDILFLNQPRGPVNPGDIVVFNTNDRDIPIVHRIIKTHERPDGQNIDFLTKGDNNWGDDRSLYPKGMMWLQPKHVLGRVVGFLPYVGRLTIIMNDYPVLKYVLIGSLGLFVLTSKDDGLV